MLSAICVQKPKLAFQHAKLKFEDTLQTSGLNYAIVRPTAYFKSLTGQVKRVKQNRPFYFSEMAPKQHAPRFLSVIWQILCWTQFNNLRHGTKFYQSAGRNLR